MCAICGIFNRDGSPVQADELLTMRDEMTRRGPDHGGLWTDGAIGLANRRLKIIDLSPSGNQPMLNEDGTVRVVFNGEIYNFIELRRELETAGHQFRSRSDTEVIVHGYEQWGEDVFRRLSGMFAIALWDAPKRRLYLARDRYGKKPLFYFQQGGELVFASELKALAKIRRARFTLNPAAVDCYLHHLSPTQHHCIYREVAKLHPGHYLRVTAERTETVRYWQPSFRTKRAFTEGEALEAIDATLRQAVKRRMISDVPLGAFLSGGVDSSLVVAVMSKLMDRPCQTFSIGFNEQNFSELRYSAMVAKHCGTQHQEIILQPDVVGILPSLVAEYGEPFGDSSVIPTYYVSKAARSAVTVALSGDGGDELFGGYDVARASYHAATLQKLLPAPAMQALQNWFYPGGKPRPVSGALKKLRTLLGHASADPRVRHSFTQGWSPMQREALYTPAFREQIGDHQTHHIFAEFAEAIAPLKLIDQNLYYILVGRLPNDYLVKVDVASMMNSLELRSPLLDSDLGELSESIEPSLKVKGGQQKYLLKKLAERYLPAEVLYRRKQGFSLPIGEWLNTRYSRLTEQLLLEGSLSKLGWFRQEQVREIWSQHQRGIDHTHRIWTLLWLELWHRIYVDGTLHPGDFLEA